MCLYMCFHDADVCLAFSAVYAKLHMLTLFTLLFKNSSMSALATFIQIDDVYTSPVAKRRIEM